jgi:hypothetical protein
MSTRELPRLLLRVVQGRCTQVLSTGTLRVGLAPASQCNSSGLASPAAGGGLWGSAGSSNLQHRQLLQLHHVNLTRTFASNGVSSGAAAKEQVEKTPASGNGDGESSCKSAVHLLVVGRGHVGPFLQL